jgi:hypothetical protein
MQIIVIELHATFQSDQTNRNMTFLNNTFTLIKTNLIFKWNEGIYNGYCLQHERHYYKVAQKSWIHSYQLQQT